MWRLCDRLSDEQFHRANKIRSVHLTADAASKTSVTILSSLLCGEENVFKLNAAAVH